jgi:hypothetical protein
MGLSLTRNTLLACVIYLLETAMLSATEFFPVTPLLLVVLWIEAVVYLSIGTYEIFDDFLAKAP